MAIKLGFNMEDLYFFTMEDLTSMFDSYSESLDTKGTKTSGKTYSGADGLIDFVKGG